MSLIFEQDRSNHFGATINLESSEPWWLDDLRLNHAKKMTLEAELGLRRPIHIVVATNRSAPFEDIANSLLQFQLQQDSFWENPVQSFAGHTLQWIPHLLVA